MAARTPNRGGKERLTDRAIAAWIKRGMPGKLGDGAALFLIATGSGPTWRVKYRHGGRENSYTVGRYGTGADEYTLARARDERGKVRAWLEAGLDPNTEKQAARARASNVQGDTFAAVAEQWYAAQVKAWSNGHAIARRRLLDRFLLQPLGPLPIAEVAGPTGAPRVLDALRAIEPAHELLAKSRIIASQICRYAISTGRGTADPTLALRGAFVRPPVVNRATVAAAEMPALFAALAALPAELSTRLALYFQIATCVRPGEVRFATWGEIDGHVWRIPAERMKMREAFVQPLSALALAILKAARPLRSADDPGALIFPGFTRTGTLSEAAFTALLARAGFYGRQTAHGFRSAFASWAHERAEKMRFDPVAIELCLAHRPAGVAGVYNRSQYIESRLKILTAWAKQLSAWGLRLP